MAKARSQARPDNNPHATTAAVNNDQPAIASANHTVCATCQPAEIISAQMTA